MTYTIVINDVVTCLHGLLVVINYRWLSNVGKIVDVLFRVEACVFGLHKLIIIKCCAGEWFVYNRHMGTLEINLEVTIILCKYYKYY